MEHSESIKNISEALRKFQGAVGPVAKSAVNPFFKSKYAPLEAIIEHTQEHLVREGLSYSQFPDGEGLTTILMHDRGEWMKATMKVHMGAKPQDQGSAITYARRYALSAVLGLATEDDDDGNAASQPKAATAPKTAPTAKKEGDRTLAAKDRIYSLLGLLKVPRATKSDIETAVKKLTKLDLVPENYDAIGEALSAQLEQREAKQ